MTPPEKSAAPRGRGVALFENVLIAFIIGIFILSAVQSSLFVLSGGYGRAFNHRISLDSYGELRRSYNDFESAFINFISGEGPVSAEQLAETFSYFENYTRLGPLAAQELRRLPPDKIGLARDFEESLDRMNALLVRMKKAPDGKTDREMRAEFVRINMAMPSIARIFLDARSSLISEQTRNEHLYLLLTIICMSGAGLGLIFLLLAKLSLLQRLFSERDAMLALSNRRLAAIEAAGDGIGLVDPQGDLIYMNRALMALHGIGENEADQYIGHSWHRLYSEKGVGAIREKVMPVLGRQGYWKGDAPVARRDGSVVWAEMSLTMLPDGGLLGTASDISERKRGEKEREELQKQVFQAQKMEAIGRLAGGVAHDFNNILASILGYAEFLTDDLPHGGPEHLFASRIRSGGQQAKRLVEQLLAFSRPQEGAREILDLRDIAAETRDMLSASQPPSIAIETVFPDAPVLVNGNPTQIGQILMNLGLNATDAMEQEGVLYISVHEAAPARTIHMSVGSPAGGLIEEDEDEEAGEDGGGKAKGALAYRTMSEEDGAVRAWLGTLREGGNYIRIRVVDSGCGMSEDIVERIFEPFFTTKPVDRGTGLGLSSVHGLLAAHGGALALHTRPGSGSTFDLFLPAAAGAGAVPGRGRILIVEDDAEVRAMIGLMVKRLGYDAVSCEHGLGAVDAIREGAGEFDLVISDYMMPDMTGGDLAEQIAPDFPRLPILILTGYSRDEANEMRKKYPSIRSVMAKPVDSATLSREIRAALEGAARA
jgi:PAS domain S-box-containing protein